ncbi:CRISPR-associated helicase Cas3' [Paenibacillus apis]|uniref:CRISPR-associated helicase/endonuclease Cas3 n=1 Tax=Paenibacillus apis TaxID=1792174 RepID=A0A919Y7J3_9BACL|nr:CRISPR-associated helicase Cas3' [Paenibacillus apis]GIO43923.1 CRISPR-associated helicase/endonuclease Cas3 [Paenibacillus apis]
MDYIAHVRESDGEPQPLEHHLLGAQRLAEFAGEALGIRHITGLAGLLHDLGKYAIAFQNYLREAVAHPEAPPKRGSVDHSTAGGRLLYDLYHTGTIERGKGTLAEIVGNAIISHHSSLHDYISPELEMPYLRRVRDKEDVPEYEACTRLFFERVMNREAFEQYVERAVLEMDAYFAIPSSFTMEMKCLYLTKYVFSALIDADRTDTRRFEEQIAESEEQAPNTEELFENYYTKLMDKLGGLVGHTSAASRVNQQRREMSEQCERSAYKPSGIYTLSIPTGGGKTLASLRYALRHAIEHHKKRIIYVLPYTTIIEQNAAEVRGILQDDIHILEHHSNVIDELNDDEMDDGLIHIRQKLKLAKDNWDCPITFTTMVQFLNVFYAKSNRNVRRLRHLAESVIIFDEVQKVPVSCVSLFNEALNFLNSYGQSSMVLCTATQPALDVVEHELHLSPDAEIVSNLDDVIKAFKRVELSDEATSRVFTNESLAEWVLARLEEKRDMLIILNTKAVVKNLYERLKGMEHGAVVYHLSTSMCAAHRKTELDKIRGCLDRKEKVICVSTPLIEAGVDVSFQCVVRSLAGLDSVAQAAGRCNRHGEESLQQVYMIDHAEENLKHLSEVRKGKDITKRMLTDMHRDESAHGGFLLSDKALRFYFKQFYADVRPLLKFEIPKLKQNMMKLLFAQFQENDYFQDYCQSYAKRPPQYLLNSPRTAADHFRVIEDLTTPVIAPYGEGAHIIAELNGASRIEDLGRLLRQAQQYTVNLFPYEKIRLDQNQGLEACLDGQILVMREGAYSEEFGLDLENDSWGGASIF